jgi:Kef-type K+ transport system membrane component KefB
MLGAAPPSVPLPPLGDHELLVFWVQLLVLLLAARMGGYAMRALGQPRVVGEICAGVLLGPSIAGEIWPDGWRWLFPDSDRQAGLLLGLAWFGIVLLLMTTGVETDPSEIRRQGRAATWTAVGSLIVPLGAGFGIGWVLPDEFLGAAGGRATFASFIGIALAISSLPVAARIMSDLGILSSPVGQLVLAAATSNDVVGWILLGVLAGSLESDGFAATDLATAVIGMAVVTVVVLALGRSLLDRAMRMVRARGGETPAAASVAVLFTVAVGAATHAAGIEVVIGAFLAGIAIGGSTLAREPAMRHLDDITNAVFAPLFFAIAGVRVDFRALDSRDVIVGAVLVTVVATLAKLVGAYTGGRFGGLDRRDSMAAASALNARGALEIVVATVGISIGVLSDASYSAIVVMAIVTTALAGPLLRVTYRHRPPEPRRRLRSAP